MFSCPVGDSRAIVGDRSLQCVGKGTCIRATGTCKCEQGYTGSNCGACDSGYKAINGACFVPHSPSNGTDGIQAVSPRENADFSDARASGVDDATLDLLIGVVFGILGLFLVAVGVFWVVALRRRAAASTHEQLLVAAPPLFGGSGAQEPRVTESSAADEPQLPTRQLAEQLV